MESPDIAAPIEESPIEQAPAPETPAPETAAPDTAGEQGSPEWVDQITQRLDEMRDDFGLMGVPEQPGEQQQAPSERFFPAAPEEDAEQSAFTDPYGREPDEQEAARNELRDYLRSEIDEATNARLEPFFEQEMTRQRVSAAMELEAEFPELKDPRVATPVVQMGQQLLAEMGMAEGANHPGFAKLIRMIYMASRAEAAAASEMPAGQQTGEFSVETPGARAPASQQQGEPDLGDLIVQSGEAARLPFQR